MKKILIIKYLMFSIFIWLFCSISIAQNNEWLPGFGSPGTGGSQVFDITPFRDGVLVANWSTSRFGGELFTDYVAYYDGVTYSRLGTLSPAVGDVRALTTDAQGNAYLGGGILFEGTNSDGTTVLSRNIVQWNEQLSRYENLGNGVAGRVYDILVNDDYVYVVGSLTQAFNATDTIAVRNIARYNRSTQRWDDVDGGVTTSGFVLCIEQISTGEIIIGGTNIETAGPDDIEILGVASFSDADGWSTFDGGLPDIRSDSITSTVYDLEYDEINDRLFAVGNFGEFASTVGGFAVWQGGVWSFNNNLGPTFSIRTVHYSQQTGLVYMGGYFDFTGTLPNTTVGIMTYDPANGQFGKLGESGIDPIRNVDVITEASNGDFYLGGTFTEIDNIRVNYFVRYSPLTGYDALGRGFEIDSYINSVLKYKGNVIAGGYFNGVDTLSSPSGVAMLNRQTNRWEDIGGGVKNGNFSGIIEDMVIHEDTLWITGLFDRVGDEFTNGVAAWSFLTEEWITFGNGLEGPSNRGYSIEVVGDDIYVGGFFSSVSGVSAENIARYRNGQWENIGDFQFGVTIRALEAAGNDLLVGGNFREINGSLPINALARLRDGEIWEDAFASYSINSTVANVLTIAYNPSNGQITVGGTNMNSLIDDQGNLTNLDFEFFMVQDKSISQPEPYLGRLYNLKYGPQGNLWVSGEIELDAVPSSRGLAVYKQNCNEWQDLGVGIKDNGISNPSAIRDFVFLEDSVYAGGLFERAGNTQSHAFGLYIAEEIFLTDCTAPANNPPTVANPIPDQTVEAGGSLQYIIPANTFSDPDGDALSYTTGTLPGFADFTPNDRTFFFNPQETDEGQYNIEVIAIDPDGAQVSDIFQLTVTAPVNNPPTVANPIPDQTVEAGSSLQYTFPTNTFSDPDGDALSYTTSTLPSFADFTPNDRTFFFNPQETDEGQYNIEVIAIDPDGAQVSDIFQLTVTVPVNNPPTVANPIPDQTFEAGEPINYTIPENIFSDPDGDQLNISINTLPGFLSYDQNTRSISGTPGDQDVGNYTIEIIATDPDGATISTVLQIFINAKNLSVSIQTTDQSVCFGESGFYQAVINKNISVNYEWLLEGELVSQSQLLTLDNLTGNVQLQVKVSSGNEEALSEILTIEVNPMPEANLQNEAFFLHASPGADYNWYLDGELIEAFGQTIIASDLGIYQVEVINEFGCSALSEMVTVIITADEQIISNPVSVYPNPVKGQFRLQLNGLRPQEVKIIDMKGITNPLSLHGTPLFDITGYAPGIYVIDISTQFNHFQIKIVKQ